MLAEHYYYPRGVRRAQAIFYQTMHSNFQVKIVLGSEKWTHHISLRKTNFRWSSQTSVEEFLQKNMRIKMRKLDQQASTYFFNCVWIVSLMSHNGLNFPNWFHKTHSFKSHILTKNEANSWLVEDSQFWLSFDSVVPHFFSVLHQFDSALAQLFSSLTQLRLSYDSVFRSFNLAQFCTEKAHCVILECLPINC